MHYTLTDGAKVQKKAKRRLVIGVGSLLLVAGLYLLYNTLSPALPVPGGDDQVTAKKLTVSTPAVSDNRLYLPQINVDIKIVEIKKGETEAQALDKGAIHRSPNSGNPKDGGNYVLAAHRFTLGFTPFETRAKSPLYHIDEMRVGDQVYVDYGGTRYAYKVSEKKTVSASDVAIENRTKEPTLTIYSCTLSGANDGREVLFAKQLGTVTWDNGSPKISPISD